MSFSKITASGYILPNKVLTNEDLCERFDPKKIKGISKLSGITKRRVAPNEVTSVDLGYEAAKRMIESCNIDKSSIDMLVFVTQTPDYLMPASAFIVHDKLGLASNCGAFDLANGCGAFPYAMSVANGLIASGQCKKILLIFAETITKLVHPNDHSLATLHGDGAACFIMETSEDFKSVDFIELGSDSSGWKHLIVPDGGFRNPLKASSYEEKIDDYGIKTTDASLQMNGAAVFHFGISTIPTFIKNSLDSNNSKVEEYSLILFHQANKMMISSIYNTIGATKDQQFFFMEEIGNLSVASTPVLLAEALRQGKLDNAGKVLLTSFGIGLTYGLVSMNFYKDQVAVCQSSTEF